MSRRGGFGEPAGRGDEDETARAAPLPRPENGELVPAEPGARPAPGGTDGADITIPGSAHLPEQVPPKLIVMKPRTLRRLLMMIAALVLVVVALATVLILRSGDKSPALASSTGSATPGASAASASASSTGASPTDSGSASGGSGPSASSGPGASGSAGATGSAAAGPGSSSLPTGSVSAPFGTQYLAAPVDGGGDVSTGSDVHISDVDYANSVSFYCPTSGMIDWNVAGYTTFSAVYGIPDTASGATGVSDTVTFTDQNGKVLKVSTATIGQPQTLTIPISGVDRLVVSCSRQGSNDSANNIVAFGNALTSTSS